MHIYIQFVNKKVSAWQDLNLRLLHSEIYKAKKDTAKAITEKEQAEKENIVDKYVIRFTNTP